MPVKQFRSCIGITYNCPECNTFKSFTTKEMLLHHIETEHRSLSSKSLDYNRTSSNFLSHGSARYTKEAGKLRQKLAELTRVEKQSLEDIYMPQSHERLSTMHSLLGTQLSGDDPFTIAYKSNKYDHSVNTHGLSFQPTTTSGTLSSSNCNSSLWTYTNKEVSDLRHHIDRLTEQLKYKDTQLKKAREELQLLSSDRRDLQRQILDVSKEKEDFSNKSVALESTVHKKHRLLLEKENEVNAMSTFLHNLSLKEGEAREELEAYIINLTARAELAESKLKESSRKHSDSSEEHLSNFSKTYPQSLKRGSRDLANYSMPLQKLELSQSLTHKPGISSWKLPQQPFNTNYDSMKEPHMNYMNYLEMQQDLPCTPCLLENNKYLRNLSELSTPKTREENYVAATKYEDYLQPSELILRQSEMSNNGMSTCQYGLVLHLVFMYLDIKTLSKVSQVSKVWKEVSRDPSLWQHIDIKNAKVSSKFFSTISTWCTELQILHLSGLRANPRKTHELKEEYEKSLSGSLELGLEHLLRSCSKKLISLKVQDCGELITERLLWLAGCYSVNLERFAYISDTFPAGAEAVYSLAAGCRTITTLLLQPQFPSYHPHKFNNKAVQMLAKCWPALRVLCIGGVDVNGKGLACIGKHCAAIEVLELDHMSEVTESTATAMCIQGALQCLHTLAFTFTVVTPRALLQFVEHCPSLRKIYVKIGVSDYFDDTTDPENCQQFEEIIKNLKILKDRPEFKDVLLIRSDYG